MSTRLFARSLPLMGVLSLLAASSAFAQIDRSTIVTTAKAAGDPVVETTATNAAGETRPTPDTVYIRTIRSALGDSDWYFLTNNTVVVALGPEILMTLRATPRFDGSSWNLSHSTQIGNATYTITGMVRRGVRNGNNFNPNAGFAELFMVTASPNGRRATTELVLPLVFATVVNGSVGVVNTDTGTFTTAAQGGVRSSGGSTNVNGGTSTTSTTTPAGGSGARREPGWGVRLWPVPWG